MTPPLIAAASLILLRQPDRGTPELLIVQRGATLAFAGGAYVFPGGRVDPADRAAAGRACPACDPEDGAARIAALRETFEETGLAVTGWSPDAGPVAGGAAHLIPFARWCPDTGVARRFDTRFYLAEAIDAAAEPVADGIESSRAFWASAASMLARCAAGDGHAIFPTRRLLERLARFDDIAAIRADALRWPAQTITPWIEARGDGDWLCIPADAGYPVTEERLEGVKRG